MMRRLGLGLAAALVCMGSLSSAAGLEYVPRLDRDKLSEGQTVLLKFRTDWCLACDRHAEILEKLTSENPAYGEAITTIVVDYDTFGNSQMADRRRVKQNATLLLLRGRRELGRIEGAVMREDEVRKLLELALQ
ncbi:thioredoxin family protein [Nereida sp. MMG025]|uniref:TlpA family protein disulfide reductase n=1 Tax=Nereida sp. MMG025 TaxID=2909981 RepID=UPI001F214F4C|nr:thioredoxin family protein [Nereida sp. MMG025]